MIICDNNTVFAKSDFWSKTRQPAPVSPTTRTSPIFPPITCFVAPRIGWYVIVDVRVASPSAKPASTQSQ